jgi:hypothetical protein
LAALLHRLEHEVDQRRAGPRLDRRNRRTGRQLVLGVVVKRSTRLRALGQIVAPPRRAGSVKAAAQGVAYFLRQAKFPAAAFSVGLLEEAVRQVDPTRLVTYKGKVLVVLDPTEYEKRSRERGKCGRRSKSRPPKTTKRPTQQQSGGRPASAQTETRRTATTPGYVDIWAGLVLKGKQILPLARQLFSSRHPQCTSQNAVEEAVLARALALLHRLGLRAIVLGDKGLGRKELIIRLANQEQDAILRVDTDITVFPPPTASCWLPRWPSSPGAGRWTGIAGKRGSCTAACTAACARCVRPSASVARAASLHYSRRWKEAARRSQSGWLG